MELTKIIACLSCCVALCVPSAFAVDDIPWTPVDVNTQSVTINQGEVSWSEIVERVWTVDPPPSDETIFVNTGTSPWLQTGLNGYSYTVSELPPKYSETSTSRYTDYSSIGMFNVSAISIRIATSIVLQPGFYQADFGSVFTMNTNTDSSARRASVYSWYFAGASGAAVVPFYSQDRVTAYVELTEPSRLCVNVSYPSFTISNTFTGSNADTYTNDLTFNFSMYNPSFKYRAVDSIALDALDESNTGATTTLDDYNGIESQWTGSMTQNFNALGIGNFSFGSSLISAFALISGIFMNIWNTMGDYAVVYTFPLYLGIVLLVIGRISKFAGSQGSGQKRGDGDA